MKRFGGILITLVTLGLLIAGPAFSASFESRNEYVLQHGEKLVGDVYIAGGGVVFSGGVDGDLATVGGNVLINGPIGGDVLVVGGTITVLGTVGDDVRAIGGQVVIGGTVEGDVIAVGGSVRTLSDSVVRGDVAANGGQVIVNGSVGGKVRAAGGRVQIDGTVDKGVRIDVADTVRIGSGASIGGDLVYTSRKEADISPDASITGEIVFEERSEVPYSDPGPRLASLISAIVFFKLIGLVIVAILVVFLFKNFSEDLVKRTLSHFGKDLVRGFIVFVAVPIAVILLFFTLIGVYLGVILAALYVLLLLVSSVFGAVLFGGFLAQLARQEVVVDWKWAGLGVVVLAVLQFIPIIGWLVSLVFLLAALGFISWALYQRMWLRR